MLLGNWNLEFDPVNTRAMGWLESALLEFADCAFVAATTSLWEFERWNLLLWKFDALTSREPAILESGKWFFEIIHRGVTDELDHYMGDDVCFSMLPMGARSAESGKSENRNLLLTSVLQYRGRAHPPVSCGRIEVYS